MDSQDVFNFNLDELSLDMELSQFNELLAFGEKSEVKDGGSVDSPAGSPAPTSPGSEIPPLDAKYEDVFLDENGVAVELTDPDIINSQEQQLMYIANKLQLDEFMNNITGTQTTEADNTSSEIEVKPVVIPVAGQSHVGKMKTPKRSTGRSPYTASTSKPAMVSDEDLISLSVKDLNKALQGLPRETVLSLKQKRRTLKNRGYAANSREKRQVVKSELEQVNHILLSEVDQLRRESQELDVYKQEVERLRAEMAQVKLERDRFKQERDNLMAQFSNPCSPNLFEEM